MSEREEEQDEPLRRLSDFIRAHRQALIAEWTQRVRKLSPARELSSSALVDHLPQILARIEEMTVHAGGTVRSAEAPRQHAIDRLARGFDLDEVIREFSVLRQCILALWERNVGTTITIAELQRLDAALDQSISESSVSFSQARERMLKALDRISEAALGTAALDRFLRELLQVTVETTEVVDTAAVFLRDGEVLRLRAAVGLEPDATRSFSVKLGEAIADQIAAQVQGVRAVYGVPLGARGQVIGVAYMGSRSAFEFSEEDKLLFRTMASRATSLIVQTQLVADLEKMVADRDRLVSQLAGERARLEQILNQVPTGVLIAEAPDGTISFVNRRCQEILGHPLAPSAPASEYQGWKLFHDDGRPYAPTETPRHRALQGEQLVDECKVKRPDGGWATLRAQAAPVRGPRADLQSAIIAFDDISEQKRYEERLRFLSEASRQLAESVDYEATLAQIARLALPGIADWFIVDLRRGDELGSVVFAHSDPAKVALVKDYRRRFPPDRDTSRGLAKVLRDGQPELSEDVMIVPLRVRGRVEGAITFVSAESGRRYVRDDLEMAQGLADRAATAIENARLFLEAERAIRLREEVLAVVSHDLRNPLSTINMSAALLAKRGAEDARMRKHVDSILRATGRMSHLIGDLLDLASIQAGRLAVERKTQELAPIIAEAVEIAEPLARANGQTLTTDLQVGAARSSVDRERVLQVFANLLGNAQKFGPAGGSIAVRAVVKESEIECSVSDAGPGISQADLPHIFDPYWSAKPEGKGVGLGLYICKGIVEAHGGRIWVDSRPGAGATFYFTLPLV